MCGRFTVIGSPQTLRSAFGYEETPDFPPRYNIAPGQPVAIVRMELGARHFALIRWGFVPGWAKDIDEHGIMINARAETITERPSFRNAMKRRRCLFIADGYYEWQKQKKQKKQGRGPSRPFYFRRKDAAVFAIAGIWEHWTSRDGAELETAALITVAANAATSPIHHRMPALLRPRDYEQWLDEKEKPQKAAALLKPAEEDALEFWPVSTRVNRVTNDAPELIKPVTTPEMPGTQLKLFL